MKKFLVTCALPYSNGLIHIGHMLEHIQADIWVRYHRMKNRTVWFICGDDNHGTPVMLKAQKMKVSPIELVKKMYKKHKSDLLNFGISYDYYHFTHTPENHFFLKKIYFILKKKKLISKKKILQFYDCKKKMFLPDRYISGTCPVCKKKSQYGDNCESCGSIYSSIDLIDPISTVSNSKPILKKSMHFFFNLPVFKNMLNKWIRTGVLEDDNQLNKIQEWFRSGLKKWDISRDYPYFGFPIPNHKKKFFYVWLDAPVGYISIFKNFCLKNKKVNFLDFWKKGSKNKLFHFIGKDICYFHSLFWPSILEASGFRKPTKIFIHGHVTLNGKKLSKSKGSVIYARDWLRHFNPDSLRYYYASKLNSRSVDIEMNFKDFLSKINSDLVNKLVNLASRSAKFINKYFLDTLSHNIVDNGLYNKFVLGTKKIEKMFESRNFSLVIKEIMKFTSYANKYIDLNSPWTMYKIHGATVELHNVVSMGLFLFKIIMTWLKPIVPFLANKVEKFLNIKLKWKDISIPLLSHKINKFFYLYKRIKKSQSFKF